MAISKVVLHDDSGADRTLVDLTGDTVAPETLMKGTTAHDKAGNLITGTAKPGGGGNRVQSDWAENDPQSPAYVKNRFGGYEGITEAEQLPLERRSFVDNGDGTFGCDASGPDFSNITMATGETKVVFWDGAEYVCPVIHIEDEYGVLDYFGNGELYGLDPADFPFLCYLEGGAYVWTTNSPGIYHVFSVSGQQVGPIKIDPKYLPPSTGSLSEKEVETVAINTIENGSKLQGPASRIKIKSSTPGSNKMFYMSVDDSHRISIVEALD